MPIDLPWTVQQTLRTRLTALQQRTAESAAQQLLDQRQAVCNGYLRLPAFYLPATSDPEPPIRAALERG